MKLKLAPIFVTTARSVCGYGLHKSEARSQMVETGLGHVKQ